MKLPAENTVSGKWLDKKELKNGDQLKIVTEATLEMGQNGEQLVAKVKVKGGDNEAKNIAINKPSRKALVAAFGDDTSLWIEKIVTAAVEKTMMAGKRGIALYLIPDGFELGEDEGGYLVVHRKPHAAEEGSQIDYPEEDIKPEDIPF